MSEVDLCLLCDAVAAIAAATAAIAQHGDNWAQAEETTMAIKKNKTSVDKNSSRCDTNLVPSATQNRRMDGHGHGGSAREGTNETDEKNIMEEEKDEKKNARENFFTIFSRSQTKKMKKKSVRRTHSTHEELEMH